MREQINEGRCTRHRSFDPVRFGVIWLRAVTLSQILEYLLPMVFATIVASYENRCEHDHE